VILEFLVDPEHLEIQLPEVLAFLGKYLEHPEHLAHLAFLEVLVHLVLLDHPEFPGKYLRHPEHPETPEFPVFLEFLVVLEFLDDLEYHRFPDQVDLPKIFFLHIRKPLPKHKFHLEQKEPDY
jgi:hypothetical protein